MYPNVKHTLSTSLTSYKPTKNGYLLCLAVRDSDLATIALVLPSGYERRAMPMTGLNGVTDIYVKAGDTVKIEATRCHVARLEFYTND